MKCSLSEQSDANASPGVRKKHDDPFAPGRDKVRGPFGMVHENNAGQDLCSILGTNELCLATEISTTFFRHKRYATWRHPCSKLWHQLDHCVVRQKDLKRVLNARVMGLLGKDSDHMAISLKLRIGKGLKRKRTDKQIKARRIDRGLLKVPEVATQFRARVVQEMSTDRGQTTELSQLQEAKSHTKRRSTYPTDKPNSTMQCTTPLMNTTTKWNTNLTRTMIHRTALGSINSPSLDLRLIMMAKMTRFYLTFNMFHRF